MVDYSLRLIFTETSPKIVLDFSCDEACFLSAAPEVASADAKNDEANMTSNSVTIDQGHTYLSKFQTYLFTTYIEFSVTML